MNLLVQVEDERHVTQSQSPGAVSAPPKQNQPMLTDPRCKLTECWVLCTSKNLRSPAMRQTNTDSSGTPVIPSPPAGSWDGESGRWLENRQTAPASASVRSLSVPSSSDKSPSIAVAEIVTLWVWQEEWRWAHFTNEKLEVSWLVRSRPDGGFALPFVVAGFSAYDLSQQNK